MPWNYGFFIRFFIRKENGYKAKVQINQCTKRLNRKENGHEKWIKTTHSSSFSNIILQVLYFRFLGWKSGNVRTLLQFKKE